MAFIEVTQISKKGGKNTETKKCINTQCIVLVQPTNANDVGCELIVKDYAVFIDTRPCSIITVKESYDIILDLLKVEYCG